MRLNAFTRLLLLFVGYYWFIQFGGSVLPTYFLEKGISINQLLFGRFLTFAGPLLLFFTVKHLRARFSYRMALICFLLYLLLVVHIFHPYQFFLASVFAGLPLFFYFIFYNTSYFEAASKEKRGQAAALMFSLPTLIDVLAPFVAGIAISTNITIVWIVAVISFCATLATVNLQTDFELRYSLTQSLEEIKATRAYLFFAGIWEALVFAVLPIYTLHFIQTPASYGTFLAYLAIVAAIANLLLGKLTDKMQKRVVFLYPVTAIMVLATLLFPLALHNLRLWILLSTVISFVMPIFHNLSTAMVVDAHPDLRKAIPGREFILSVSRVLGLALVSIAFWLSQSPAFLFYVLAGALSLFPLLLFWNTKISRKYQYLWRKLLPGCRSKTYLTSLLDTH